MSARQDNMHSLSDQQQSQQSQSQGQGQSRDRDARALLSLLQPSSSSQSQSQQQQQQPLPTLPTVPAPISGDIYHTSLYPPVAPSNTAADVRGPASSGERDTRASISVDALFRTIAGNSGSNTNNNPLPPSQHHHQQQQQQNEQQSSLSSDYDFLNHPNSTSTSASQQPQGPQQPQSHPMDSPAASSTASINTERQNALLSLLGNVGSPPASDGGSLDQASSLSGHRPLPQLGSNESQSRYLLDQILPQQQQPHQQQAQIGPQPISETYRSDSPTFNDHDLTDSSHTLSQAPLPHPSYQHQPQQQLPSASAPHRNASPAETSASASGAEAQVLDPTRRTRFDYFSPYDALGAGPVPQMPKPPSPPLSSQSQQQQQYSSQAQQFQPNQSPNQNQYGLPPSLLNSGPGPNRKKMSGDAASLGAGSGIGIGPTSSPPIPFPSGAGGGNIVGPGPAVRPTSPRIQEIQAEAQQMPFPTAGSGTAPGRRGSTPETGLFRNQSDAEAGIGAGLGSVGGVERDRPVNPAAASRSSPSQYVTAGSGSGGSPGPESSPSINNNSALAHAVLRDLQPQQGTSPQQQQLQSQVQQQAQVEAQSGLRDRDFAKEREREKDASKKSGSEAGSRLGKRGSPSTVNAPTYTLDLNAPVNQPIAAAQGLSAVTPIALLRLENVYSAGTTIGVSSFIAYAMTRGRVRLIARSNGSRFLLHLPNNNYAGGANTGSGGGGVSAHAVDMVVSGNKLACVTSEGGLVIWDVPDELDENPVVPVVLHVSATDHQRNGAAYALKLAKWHPSAGSSHPEDGGEDVASAGGLLNGSGTIAVASDREVYIFNVNEAYNAFKGEEITLADLGSISSVISVPSPLVGFSFDEAESALVTLSIDSTISCWDINERTSFWSGRVAGSGEMGLPSSIDVLPEFGVLVGRKQGTVLQLLPSANHVPCATIKLVAATSSSGNNKNKEQTTSDDESIFAHVSYDPRLKIIWAAHSARASLFAIRLGFDSNTNVPTIDQITDFPIPMQCINMTILGSGGNGSGGAYGTDDLISLGDSSSGSGPGPGATNVGNGGSGALGGTANPNSAAVAAFAMHSGGVDQINIPMGVFESAIANVATKLPSVTYADGSAGNVPSGMKRVVQPPPQQAQAMTSGNTNQNQASSGSSSNNTIRNPNSSPAPAFGGPINPPSYTEVAAHAIPRPRSPLSEVEAEIQQQHGPSTAPQPHTIQPSNASSGGVGGKKKNAGGSTASPTPRSVSKGSAAGGLGASVSSRNAPATASGSGANIGSGEGSSGQGLPKDVEGTASGSGSGGGVSAAILAKDLRKVEDNLHSRIGKLLTKELDRQQQRIDDQRRVDQEADFSRQETILKLISTELTKNTTRVVEQAIKSEVQTTVLPALENVAKNEIRAAMNNQLPKNLSESLNRQLPSEIERLLLRSDITAHLSRSFTNTFSPHMERQIKDAITQVLIPSYQQTSQQMQHELVREFSSEIVSLKKEVLAWQSEAIRSNETVVRELEQSVRSLGDQVRSLTLQVQSQATTIQTSIGGLRGSPAGALPPQPIQSNQPLQHPLPHQHVSTSSHLRSGASLAGFNSASALPSLLPQQIQQPQPPLPTTNWQSSLQTQQPPQQSAPQPQQQQAYGSPSNVPISQPLSQQYVPQSSYGKQQLPQQQPTLQPAPPPMQQQQQLPPQQPPQQPQQQQVQQQQQQQQQQRGVPMVPNEDWDEIFLQTLQRQDPRQLRDLLASCNPDVIMPAKKELSPIGQAVVLTLIHRLSESLPDMSPNDDGLRPALWWLQRSAYSLNPSDPMIESYVGPVLSTTQQILGGTANRFAAYPDLQGTISQIQRTLSVKP